MIDQNSKPLKLHSSWTPRLKQEFSKNYMKTLSKFLLEQKKKKKVIYPRGSQIFSCLDQTPFEKVRVVILGQDPYHGAKQAHGLSFSVPRDVVIPPSLKNIYKELKNDLEIPSPSHGDLSFWAHQGVLLLNSVLTVEAGKAGSHQGQGWEIFTDQIIRILNQDRSHLVFLLWGSYAQKKGMFIDKNKHLVLTASHPSPLSCYRGFLGCGHFSKANTYLQSKNLEPIRWCVSSM